MSDIQEKQDIIENELNDIEDEISLLKPKRKMKKFPRTEKQQEAFKITMQKRAENVAKRKELKKIEAAKLLMSLEPSKEIEQAPPEEIPKKVKKPKKKIVLTDSESESDDDDSDASDESEEKIYIARKSIKQPKKVYIIKKEVKDEEEDEKPVNKFKSQQNKKSVVKISNNQNIQPLKNYFCD